MKPSSIFALAVRLVGVFLLYKAVMALTGYFTVADLPSSMSSMEHISRPMLLHVMLLTTAAIWFLFGARPIQDWAYPEATHEKDWDSDESPKGQGPFCVACGKPIPAGSKNCPACGWTQPG